LIEVPIYFPLLGKSAATFIGALRISQKEDNNNNNNNNTNNNNNNKNNNNNDSNSVN